MRITDHHDGPGPSGRDGGAPRANHSSDARLLAGVTAVAADTNTSNSERTVAAASGHAPNARDRTGDVEERGGDQDARTDHPPAYGWLLLVPIAATAVGVAVGLAFGFDVFDPGPPGDISLLPYLVLVPYFLAGLAGTLWLLEDAARLAAADADWQPNPWLYVTAGALVLEAVVAAPVVRGDVTTGVVPYLAGGFVLAALLSSVVVGPVYFVMRRRALDAP